jgi:ech hydrogenase subunit A
MALGICGMFIAPFGMLISKWAALAAFIDSGNIILVFMLVFGSAVTFFFWGKWLGKITAYMGGKSDIEGTVRSEEWVSIGLMALLTAGVAIFFPLISTAVVVPYIGPMFHLATVSLAVSTDNLYIMAVIVLFMIFVLGLSLGKGALKTELPVYMSGVGTPDGGAAFTGSLGGTVDATQRNWYMESYFGEVKLSRIGTIIAIVVLVIGLSVAMLFGGVM